MTRGEAIFKYRNELVVENGEWVIEGKRIPKRMKTPEALEYYGKKLNDAWLELGYLKERKSWHRHWLEYEHMVAHLPSPLQELMKKIFKEGYRIGCNECRNISRK